MSVQSKSWQTKKGKVVKWYVVQSIEGKVVWSKSYSTKREALAHDLDQLVPKGSKTIDQLAKEWLAYSKPNYAVSTWKVYEYDYYKFISDKLGDKLVTSITTEEMFRFREWGITNYSVELTNKLINILSNVFKYGITIKVIKDNPCDHIKRSQGVQVYRKTWTTKEIGKFFGMPQVRESPYFTPLLLLFITGMRPSEVCGLQFSNLKGNVLTLTNGYTKHKELSNMKTMKSHRSIYLDTEIIPLLENQPRYLDDFIFHTNKGNPLTPDLLSRKFREFQKGINLSPIRLYDARHSFATNLMLSGENNKVVSDLMGNTEQVMLRTYAHLNEPIKQQVFLDYSKKILKS